MEGIGGGGRGCGVCWVNAAGQSEGRRRGGPALAAGPERAKCPVAAAVSPRACGGDKYQRELFAGRSQCQVPPPATAPPISALRGGMRPGGRCLSPRPAEPGGPPPRGGGRPPRARPTLCPLCSRRRGGGSGAAGPSRAPRSRRRSPSAGCRRDSLALAPGRGRRAPARAGAMPWGDARERRSCLIPRQPCLKREAGREWAFLQLLWHFTPKPASQHEMQSTPSLPGCHYLGRK